jgi:hypothetical protein
MKFPAQDSLPTGNPGVADAEAALRCIAGLPAQAGLEVRIKSALEVAPHAGKVLSWPAAAFSSSWVSRPVLRGAAAAAIVLVVAGGGWGIFRKAQPVRTPSAVVMPPRLAAPGGFSSAGAMRTPQTLIAPTVSQPVAAGANPIVTPKSLQQAKKKDLSRQKIQNAANTRHRD